MPYDFLGSKGLFVGIIIGLLAGGIFQWFINHDVQIHMPDSVPPAIGKSFSALIPALPLSPYSAPFTPCFPGRGWATFIC